MSSFKSNENIHKKEDESYYVRSPVFIWSVEMSFIFVEHLRDPFMKQLFCVRALWINRGSYTSGHLI